MTDVTFSRPDIELHGTDTGIGPVVLLLHAGGERRRVWDVVSEALADHGFRAVAYDQRGHGDTAATDAEALPPFAEDVAAVVQALPDPVTIVGSSLGGLAALLALSDPAVRASVASLVLVDVVPDLPEGRVREFLRETTDEIADSPLVSDILGRVADLRRAAEDLDVPTLLIRAELGYLNDSDVAKLLELIPHASVSTIPGAGHLVARDAPQLLADLLLEHLTDLPLRRVANKYSQLPEAIRLEDTIAEHDHRAVPDPESGRDTDRDFQLRNS